MDVHWIAAYMAPSFKKKNLWETQIWLTFCGEMPVEVMGVKEFVLGKCIPDTEDKTLEGWIQYVLMLKEEAEEEGEHRGYEMWKYRGTKNNRRWVMAAKALQWSEVEHAAESSRNEMTDNFSIDVKTEKPSVTSFRRDLVVLFQRNQDGSQWKYQCLRCGAKDNLYAPSIILALTLCLLTASAVNTDNSTENTLSEQLETV